MRVISQSGMFDFPYEQIVVCMDGNNVIARFVGIEKSNLLGSYSTEEKARKAMNILHEEYQYTRRFETICNGSVDYPSQPIYEFQFPKDEDVEV